MGKTKKLYLAKRMLAMILAAAMSVTMIPQTALAATADDAATEDVVNDVSSENSDTDVPAEGAVPADEDEPEVVDAADTMADTENDGQSAADTGTTAENADETENKVAVDDQAETNAEGDPAPAAEKPVYEIKVSGLETEAVYNGYEPFDLSGVELTKTENGSTESVYDTVAHKWEVKGEDGSYTAMTGEPVKAGEYQLTLSYAAVPDVHDGAEKKITCEIKKAPLSINLNPVVVKPGALKDSVKVEIDSVDVAAADQADLTKDTIVLTVTDVRNAIAGGSLKQDEKMEQDGDYVADVTPSLKPDASEAAKAAAKNYEIEPFTADIEMGELTQTQIVVALADQEGQKNVRRVYDGKPVAVPALTTEYTCEVQYLDEAGNGKKLEGAEAVGAWAEYPDCEVDEKGEVKAPTDAGTYTYILTYEDKDGVYADSEAKIEVVVAPAPVTVAITNSKEIAATAGTLMTKVLSQVTYEAKAKDRQDKEIKINAKENHIWGTGYDDANVSQIYEPAFTLQVKDGQTWKSISDADYRMEGGKEYRVIYDGKKAIYNADGTYAHRTGINSGLDENGEEINGANPNYTTVETPSTDAEALTVTVEAGVEMEWDLEALLKDGKAGKTPEEAGAKEYDSTPLFANKSDYKNKIKLKGASKSLNAVGEDFTYTWYKSEAEDLLDKEILDQNKTNGFSDYGFEDEENWTSLWNMTAPTDAGIYKLVVSYEDNTDDGTLYYVKDGAAAVVYFVIDKVQLTITPEGEYSMLSGGTPADFFYNHDIKYQMDKKLDGIEIFWGIEKYIKQDDGTNQFEESYNEFNNYTELVFDDTGKTEYKIQAFGVKYWDVGYNEYLLDGNYTTYKKVKTEKDVQNPAGETKKRAGYKEEPLGGTAPFTVNKMGEKVLNLTPVPEKLVAYEDIYDGKCLTREMVKPEEAYTLTTTKDGQPVDVPKDLVEYRYVEKTTGEDGLLEDLWMAGEYDLYACFGGNEEYAPLDLGPEPVTVPGKLIGTIKIGKRSISLELKLNDTYEAGSTTGLRSDIRDGYRVTGYAESDEWAFTDENDAWENGEPAFSVYEKGSKTPLSGNILHRNREFEIRYDAESGGLRDDFDRNYEVAAADVLCTFKTVAAPAKITSVVLGNVKQLAIGAPEVTRKDDSISQTVNVLEGIGYATSNGMTGNLAAFKISAPAEFGSQIPDTAMYKNEVEKAGGKVVAEYKNSGYFTVLFDAANGEKSFNIRWEDKYVETIKLNFDKEQCLGNLQDAVAPKKLAFNAAPKKLAIGSSVQLDVKITKAQMADVVCLGYKSSDDTVMHVNPESGYVTALKKGKADIIVFPQHMNEYGEMVPIEGATTAKVTIEGTLVTAPKPVTVSAHGTEADVNYGVVSDGYRREIYVVAGKKNAKDIEVKAKNLQGNKNQWRNDFEIEPIYQDSADESYNRLNNKYTARLTKLAPNTQYTVYVRNVCGAKTLSDGSVITQSTVDDSAAGTAVTFTTLKSEALELDLKLDETVDGITDVTWYEDYDKMPAFYPYVRTYVVDFSKIKALDSKTLGRFFLNASDPAADSDDYLDLELPLDKQYKDVYQEPKLQYYVLGKDKNGNSAKVQKNEFVSVDKKGKIKLTGITGHYDVDAEDYIDCVEIYAYDSSLDEETNIRLVISADVDSVTAKKKTVNLSVGQSVNLNDIALYTYKSGKTKLTSYRAPDMDMDVVRAAVQAQKEYFELNGNSLRAIKSGGRLELSLTDKNVKKIAEPETNATAKITFVSKELAPVKKIKAIDVTNDKFGLTFTHAGDADAFRVEIIDSSKKKLLDKRYEKTGVTKVSYEVSGNKRKWLKDTYRISATQIRDDVVAGGGKIAKESQYTVQITALYKNVTAKPASAKAKTTKIPACDSYLTDTHRFDNNDNVISVSQPRGGMKIGVSEGNYTLSYDPDNDEYNDRLWVLSGNSYTLTAYPSNRGRVNDTLAWTIGDKKVASVKAAAGTYCITLKGLKPGSTTLEVKSKILGNKVIARYDISVVAVGDAYKNGDGSTRYYGDDEPEDYADPDYPEGIDSNAPEYLPLSVGDPRKVGMSQYHYFSFTAAETAKYAFETTGSSVRIWKKSTANGSWSSCGSNLGWLTEGTTIYLRSRGDENAVNNAYYVEINLTQRMEAAENGKKVTGQDEPASFEFNAPETGQYQFSLSDENNNKETLYLYTNVQDAMNQAYTSNYGATVETQLQKGDSVWLTTRYNNLAYGVEYTLQAKKISEDVAFGTPKQVTLASDETKYLMYTIEKSGYYQFSATADTANNNVSGEIKVGTEVKTQIYGTNFSEKLELNQGDVVCVKVRNGDSADVTFTVNTTDITPADLSTATGDVKVNGTETFYAFTASMTGAYQFTLTVDQANQSDAELKIWSSMSDAESYYGSPLATGTAGTAGTDGKVTITASVLLMAGQTVYVNPVNNSGSEMTVAVAGAKDDSIPTFTTAGTEIALQADQEKKVLFIAEGTGIYSFTTADALSEKTTFELSRGGNATESMVMNKGSKLSKKMVLKAGQTVMWTMSAQGDVTFSLQAELTDPLEELKLGVAAQASVLGKNDAPDRQATATGHIFTVPEDGYYTFWSEGTADTYGILYDIGSVDADTCLLHNNMNTSGSIGAADGDGPTDEGHNYGIYCQLTKGQTVYLKSLCYFDTQSVSFTVHVGKGFRPWNN